MKLKPIKYLHALILDDEIDACRNLENYLKKYWADTIDIMGIAQSTRAAEQMMGQIKPDVIFIDIEMPGENAFQFIERIGPKDVEIIFVTAYNEYALRALKLNAIDYILKPISEEELNIAIVKLIEKLALKESLATKHPDFSVALLIDQMSKKEAPTSIVLRDRIASFVLNFKQILYLIAHGSYTHFVYEENGVKKELIMCHPLAMYEEILPNNQFYRAHKSYLVNGHFVKKIAKNEEQWEIILKNKDTIPLSRRRQLGLVDFLNTNKF